jgi:hypothetical protein
MPSLHLMDLVYYPVHAIDPRAHLHQLVERWLDMTFEPLFVEGAGVWLVHSLRKVRCVLLFCRAVAAHFRGDALQQRALKCEPWLLQMLIFQNLPQLRQTHLDRDRQTALCSAVLPPGC